MKTGTCVAPSQGPEPSSVPRSSNPIPIATASPYFSPAQFLLSRVVPQATGSGWVTRCPAHDDRTPSLSIGVGSDGRVLLYCFAGCSLAAILQGLRLAPGDLFPDGQGRRIAAIYDYEDTEWQLVRQVIRYEPKTFRQRRPDGEGGWSWNLQGVPDTVYQQPSLREGPRCFIVEGEKDAHRFLVKLELSATTNAGGAGKWRDAHTNQLVQEGVKEVIILPDNDEPGRRHAESVARSCSQAGLTVKIVELPGLPEKGDVSDWLAAGHARGELLALVEAAPVWEAPLEPSTTAARRSHRHPQPRTRSRSPTSGTRAGWSCGTEPTCGTCLSWAPG
jgi:putative DNA primase/helicase